MAPTVKPTTFRDSPAQNARLLAQLAELEAQRDELVRSMFPLIPADTLPTSTSAASQPKHVDPGNSQDSGIAGISDNPSTETLSTETTAAVLDYAHGVVKKHISLLHAYNGIRDVGQGLMGLIAEQRGVRVKEVMAEFGVGEGD